MNPEFLMNSDPEFFDITPGDPFSVKRLYLFPIPIKRDVKNAVLEIRQISNKSYAQISKEFTELGFAYTVEESALKSYANMLGDVSVYKLIEIIRLAEKLNWAGSEIKAIKTKFENLFPHGIWEENEICKKERSKINRARSEYVRKEKGAIANFENTVLEMMKCCWTSQEIIYMVLVTNSEIFHRSNISLGGFIGSKLQLSVVDNETQNEEIFIWVSFSIRDSAEIKRDDNFQLDEKRKLSELEQERERKNKLMLTQFKERLKRVYDFYWSEQSAVCLALGVFKQLDVSGGGIINLDSLPIRRLQDSQISSVYLNWQFKSFDELDASSITNPEKIEGNIQPIEFDPIEVQKKMEDMEANSTICIPDECQNACRYSHYRENICVTVQRHHL